MSDRKSAEDRANMNAIYKPVAGYFGNVVKEGRQAVKAWSNAVDASDKAKFGTRPGAPKTAAKAAASAASKKAEAERGQFFGSLIGKRYDDKGKRR